jgi:hypothetical protein
LLGAAIVLSVMRPSPVPVDVSADGFVGFGGGRFCEYGLEAEDEGDVPVAGLCEWIASVSETEVCLCASGVPFRDAGGGGAALEEFWLVPVPFDTSLAGNDGEGDAIRLPSQAGATILFLAGGGAGLSNSSALYWPDCAVR